jgi:hypothetical protein
MEAAGYSAGRRRCVPTAIKPVGPKFTLNETRDQAAGPEATPHRDRYSRSKPFHPIGQRFQIASLPADFSTDPTARGRPETLDRPGGQSCSGFARVPRIRPIVVMPCGESRVCVSCPRSYGHARGISGTGFCVVCGVRCAAPAIRPPGCRRYGLRNCRGVGRLDAGGAAVWCGVGDR